MEDEVFGYSQMNTFTIPELMRITDAINMAIKAHKGQKRKYTNEPYVVHPIRVFKILAQEFKVKDVPMLIASILHDTLEDTKLKEEEINDKFGSNVVWMVRMLTKEHNHTHSHDKEYYDAIMSSDDRVKTIKCADRLDNIRDLTTWTDQEKKKKYIEETKEYVLPIAKSVDAKIYALLMEELIKHI